MYKYLIEYLGVLIIISAKLLTNGEPIVMAIIYFSIFTMAKGVTSGYFTPFGPLSAYILGRGTIEDMSYNFLAQLLGALSAIMLFKPVKAFIE